jgi:hypothetical protein
MDAGVEFVAVDYPPLCSLKIVSVRHRRLLAFAVVDQDLSCLATERNNHHTQLIVLS